MLSSSVTAYAPDQDYISLQAIGSTTENITKPMLVKAMCLLPNTSTCGLCMHRECGKRFPCHRLQRKPLVSDPDMHHDTFVAHVPWCMSGSVTRGGGGNVSGIPGACVTRNFTYLARGPWFDTKWDPVPRRFVHLMVYKRVKSVQQSFKIRTENGKLTPTHGTPLLTWINFDYNMVSVAVAMWFVQCMNKVCIDLRNAR